MCPASEFWPSVFPWLPNDKSSVSPRWGDIPNAQLLGWAQFWGVFRMLYLLTAAASSVAPCSRLSWERHRPGCLPPSIPANLTFPLTFADVGFDFIDLRSTCLTQSKAHKGNRSKSTAGQTGLFFGIFLFRRCCGDCKGCRGSDAVTAPRS